MASCARQTNPSFSIACKKYTNQTHHKIWWEWQWAGRETKKSCCACISDLVLDVYREDSLKAETWEDRRNAVRVSEKKLTPTYKDFKKLLRHNGIKTESEYFYDSYFHQTIGGYRKFEKQFITFVSPTNNKKQTLEYLVTSVVQLKMV